jgi:hypothetical protein
MPNMAGLRAPAIRDGFRPDAKSARGRSISEGAQIQDVGPASRGSEQTFDGLFDHLVKAIGRGLNLSALGARR